MRFSSSLSFIIGVYLDTTSHRKSKRLEYKTVNKDIVAGVVNHKNIVSITYGNDAFYDKGVLEYDPMEGTLNPEPNNNNRIMAPLGVLSHELDHADQENKLYDALNKAISEGDESEEKRIRNLIRLEGAVEDKNGGELRVINGSERKLADEKGYGIRTRHDQGSTIYVEGILSTSEIKDRTLKNTREASLMRNKLSYKEKTPLQRDLRKSKE